MLMSNYISNENQRLLWKSAHQIPGFARLDPPKKDLEFKNVVEYFYRKVAHRTFLSVPELQQVNRDTLSVFLPKPSSVPSVGPISVPVPYEMVESRQEKSQRAFQERNNVYENMNKKPDLPNPEEIFREKNGDEEKIQNMDDLIMNYQKQREMDFHSIAPPVILPKSSTPVLKLLDETILTENDVDDLDESRIQQKKSVSWNKELLQPSKPDSLENRIKELEKKNEDLERRLRELENHSREKRKPVGKKEMEMEMEMEIPIMVDSVLKETIHKIENIEKMENIKNKMKMFSGVV